MTSMNTIYHSLLLFECSFLSGKCMSSSTLTTTIHASPVATIIPSMSATTPVTTLVFSMSTASPVTTTDDSTFDA